MGYSRTLVVICRFHFSSFKLSSESSISCFGFEFAFVLLFGFLSRMDSSCTKLENGNNKICYGSWYLWCPLSAFTLLTIFISIMILSDEEFSLWATFWMDWDICTRFSILGSAVSVGPLVLAFLNKALSWNKFGIVGFYVVGARALPKWNPVCLVLQWYDLWLMEIYWCNGHYLVHWDTRVIFVGLLQQILYLVSSNQEQFQLVYPKEKSTSRVQSLRKAMELLDYFWSAFVDSSQNRIIMKEILKDYLDILVPRQINGHQCSIFNLRLNRNGLWTLCQQRAEPLPSDVCFINFYLYCEWEEAQRSRLVALNVMWFIGLNDLGFQDIINSDLVSFTEHSQKF